MNKEKHLDYRLAGKNVDTKCLTFDRFPNFDLKIFNNLFKLAILLPIRPL